MNIDFIKNNLLNVANRKQFEFLRVEENGKIKKMGFIQLIFRNLCGITGTTNKKVLEYFIIKNLEQAVEEGVSFKDSKMIDLIDQVAANIGLKKDIKSKCKHQELYSLIETIKEFKDDKSDLHLNNRFFSKNFNEKNKHLFNRYTNFKEQILVKNFIEMLSKGDKKAVTNLIEHNQQLVHEEDEDGTPLLYLAIEKQDPEICEFLINHGAEINRTNRAGLTPLQLANKRNQLEIIEFLINKGADLKNIDKEALLYRALEKNNEKLAKLLISKGADIHAKDNRESSLLHQFVEKENLQAIEFLIKEGANVNVTDKQGLTPLEVITNENQGKITLKICEKLIQGGASIRRANKERILLESIVDGNISLSKHLIAEGADIHKKMQNQWTFLHLAVESKNPEAATLLINEGIDLNAATRFGNTALHLASKYGNLQMCKLLVDHQAKINAINNEGENALHLAVKEGHEEICKFLVNKNIARDVLSQSDYTPFEEACKRDNLKICELLFDKDVDVNKAIIRATIFGNPEIVAFLIEKGANISQPLRVGFLLSTLKESNPKNKTKIKKLLKTFQSETAKQFSILSLSTTLLSHAFEWKGNSLIMQGIFSGFRLELEGANGPAYFLKTFAKSLISFSQEFPNLLLPERCKEISDECLQASYQNQLSPEGILQLWQNGKKVMVSTGYSRHASTVLFSGNQFILCDRSGVFKNNHYMALQFNESKLTKEVLEKIKNLKKGTYTDYILFFSEELPRLLEFSKKIESVSSLEIEPQKVGNCTWANTEGMILPLLVLGECEKQGIDLSEVEKVKAIEFQQRKIFENWRIYQKLLIVKKFVRESMNENHTLLPDYFLLEKLSDEIDNIRMGIKLHSGSYYFLDERLAKHWDQLKINTSNIGLTITSKICKDLFNKFWPW